jgi:hypothetical protein
MPQGRLWAPLAVLAALAGGAAGQNAPSAAPMPVGDPCPPSCAAAPRVKVIVPPPEVVFSPPAPRCGGLFHRAAPCAPCAPAVAPVAAAPANAPGNGLMTFNMTYQMPYMTYQMTPMMMGSAFGGAGLSAGMFGMGGLGLPAVQPGGINLGLGGLQMGLNGSALAAALGLGSPAGLGGAGTAGVEAQLLRALLGRANGNGTEAGRAAAAEGNADAEMRQLTARLNAMATRIENELANVQRMQNEMDQGTVAISRLSERIQRLESRMDALKPAAKPNGQE